MVKIMEEHGKIHSRQNNAPAAVLLLGLEVMAYGLTGKRKPTSPKKQARPQKRKRDDVDVDKLQQAVFDLVREEGELSISTFALTTSRIRKQLIRSSPNYHSRNPRKPVSRHVTFPR